MYKLTSLQSEIPEPVVPGDASASPFAKRLIDVRTVAEMLCCGRSLVYQLIGEGEIPVVRLGRLTRVPVGAVDKFIEKKLQQGGIF